MTGNSSAYGNNKTLENIRLSVIRETDETAAAITECAEKEKMDLINQTCDDCIALSYERVTEGVREIKQTCARRVSKNSFDVFKAILSRREELIEELFTEISDELIRFTESKDYISFTENKLKQADSERPLKNAVAYIKSEDAGKIKCLGAEVRISEKIKLGGVNLFYPDEKIWVDLTLDKLLRDERNHFAHKSELEIRET
ncbi:MAG: hypothetical protein FWG44_00100 [Oscillospiraceae bacterium]|nr:hypothetical protein [Oscillospiraceae bacterium]